MTQEKIKALMANAVMTTAALANQITIQTKGQFIFGEQDYLALFQNFQVRLSKKIMPIKTQTDLANEVRDYIKEVLEAQNFNTEEEGTNAANSSNSEDDLEAAFPREGQGGDF